MINFVLGVLIGVVFTWLFYQSQRGLAVPWYSWLLFLLGSGSTMMAFDVLKGSYLEHEITAAWMGFGFFGILALIMVVGGWRLMGNRPTSES